MAFKNFFKFSFKDFRGDLFGGITAGIVALPLALAFGQQTEMGAAAGLFGAIFIGFFASLFGGTNTQISGPTAPMTAVSYLVISRVLQQFDGELERALPTILMVFFAAGVVQIIFGILKIGKYIKYIPYPVVSGFMSGIGVIIIITQLFPVLGYEPMNDESLIRQNIPRAKERLLDKILVNEAGDGIKVLDDYKITLYEAKKISTEEIRNEAKIITKRDTGTAEGTVKFLPNALQNINYLHFAMVMLTIFIIYGFKKVTTKVPSTLVALIVVSLLVFLVGWNLTLIDKIPQGFPKFQLGNMIANANFGIFSNHITDIFSLAILGAIDSLLTSVVADNMTKTKHESNQELIGQGIGNSMAAFFGGLPGAGATIRTVVNINSGGKTRLSGMTAGILLLFILLALGPVASMIPKAVLAGILITVGIGVMDYKGLKAIRKIPIADAFVMILVLVLTVFLGLIEAVALGMVISALVFMKKMGDNTAKSSIVQTVEEFEEKNETLTLTEKLPKNLIEEVYVKEFGGPLFFGVTDEIKEKLSAIPETANCLVLIMEKVNYMDQSGVFALEDAFMVIKNKGIDIVLVNLQKQPRYLMERIQIIPQLISEDQIFLDYPSAVEWIQKNVKNIF
ncbi:SulP family inorganic anion transporter [Frigoriflavimonas asaccharolytica]|uniref:SulP family sulfate permease n=1 Tax=Frigoriflavimonas asaccharolytica TaxID=2735899 RepID=A0A8J8G7L3_9FLAO|nr:SulP family inorganic anion transporter [Frigoriflavimonas asaccharolytica]NRS92771.1 SulP family sulfate permease [Frigoriflavimonas asaccharolytica]